MKICLVTAFPPSGRQLNEYAFHIASELQRNPEIELTILGDKLGSYSFATDKDGKPIEAQTELPEFRVRRCWEFNDPFNPLHLLKAVREEKPDVVWFNLVFSTFATQEHPVAAFAGLCSPALTRLFGFYTHVTLHHILEHVDFTGAGVHSRLERLFRFSGDVATRILLKANSVSVLLSGYQQTLMEKYSVRNVLLGTHGIFTPCPQPPDHSLREGRDYQILAIGHWGTYKRLETLMESFPAVQQKHPNARLVIAGANHHNRPGYWESIKAQYGNNPNIEFRGYVKEEDIPDLFRSTSVLVLPYDSSTGSSGPAHQACEFGVPIVSADIRDFRIMAADEDMAISFYKVGDAQDLSSKIVEILDSPEKQRAMADQNFYAAMRMTMPRVVRHYLRWFELERHMRSMNVSEVKAFQRWKRRARLMEKLRTGTARLNRNFTSHTIEGTDLVSLDGAQEELPEEISSRHGL